MELFLTSLHITGRESTWIDRNLKGQSRPSFSLEIASFEGEIHFYIWTEENYRNLIESQIYAQYPDVEIREVPDYTKGVQYEIGKSQMFGVEFIKSEPSPIPIKSYVDYGLDKPQEEEEKIDPITSMLEFLGSIRMGERAWIQILVRAHKKEEFAVKDGKRKKVDWTEEAEIEKKKILDTMKVENGFPRLPTKAEADKLAAIDRSISKLAFDAGIRGIYFAEPTDQFRRVVIAGLMGTMRQYNSSTLNGFKPNNPTGVDYIWQDFKDMKVNKMKKKMLKLYKQRAYFGEWKRKKFVLNTEELATIYHFPGGVATTPTIPRIMSKRSKAPSNLPV